MEGSTVVIAPPDGDMGAYLRSLDQLKALRPKLRSIAPGHGHLIENPLAKIDEYITHRLAREAQILDALQAAGTTRIDALVKQIYADVPEELHVMAGYSVWAHLLKLAEEGRAKGAELDGDWSAA
jgi:glyoxylase-like metal-dependent hydrolase (beta-lactamase superfamily II)